jgi:hypothetical protein
MASCIVGESIDGVRRAAAAGSLQRRRLIIAGGVATGPRPALRCLLR